MNIVYLFLRLGILQRNFKEKGITMGSNGCRKGVQARVWKLRRASFLRIGYQLKQKFDRRRKGSSIGAADHTKWCWRREYCWRRRQRERGGECAHRNEIARERWKPRGKHCDRGRSFPAAGGTSLWLIQAQWRAENGRASSNATWNWWRE